MKFIVTNKHFVDITANVCDVSICMSISAEIRVASYEGCTILSVQ